MTLGLSTLRRATALLRCNTRGKLSPWHDVPLSPAGASSKIFNFVSEIPRGTSAKFEIDTSAENNPIKQDVKKGKLRFYHSDSLVNYGCLPQTWEDPEHHDVDTGFLGDNDPVDVVEIGQRVARVGDIYQVKVIGALGMIDEGEMDWKLFAIALDDPLCGRIEDISDLDREIPGVTSAVRSWFRDYKIPDGKPASQFAFDGRVLPVDYALSVIAETHGAWQKLHTANCNSSKNSLPNSPKTKLWLPLDPIVSNI